MMKDIRNIGFATILACVLVAIGYELHRSSTAPAPVAQVIPKIEPSIREKLVAPDPVYQPLTDAVAKDDLDIAFVAGAVQCMRYLDQNPQAITNQFYKVGLLTWINWQTNR